MKFTRHRVLGVGQLMLVLGVLAVGWVGIRHAQAGGVPASAGAGPGASPFDLKDPARISAGEMRFQSTCADFCHGHEPALFIGRTDLEPDYIFQTITLGGRGATPMPPWGDVFTDEEIWELVAYVKSLGE